jgi:hypothetical protein
MYDFVELHSSDCQAPRHVIISALGGTSIYNDYTLQSNGY